MRVKEKAASETMLAMEDTCGGEKGLRQTATATTQFGAFGWWRGPHYFMIVASLPVEWEECVNFMAIC